MSHNSSHSPEHQITLRGIPKALWNEIKQEAKQKKTSLNKILLNRLRPPPRKTREGAAASLLDHAGTWSKAQARDFDKQLQGQRTIDPELWK